MNRVEKLPTSSLMKDTDHFSHTRVKTEQKKEHICESFSVFYWSCASFLKLIPGI